MHAHSHLHCTQLHAKFHFKTSLRIFFNFYPFSGLFLTHRQSGETADTLGALRYCKARGALVMGVTNTVCSSSLKHTYVYAYKLKLHICMFMNVSIYVFFIARTVF